MGRMYLSYLLVATFSSSFLHECLAFAFTEKCENFGLIDGESRTKITWECFPNNTKICTTREEDCTLCDGQLYISSLTKPSPVVSIAEPKTQAGRTRGGTGRGRFRVKREGSARRRSPRFGRGEIEDSDKGKKDEVDDVKKETDFVKEDTESVKEVTTEVRAGNEPFSCDHVCLEKDGKYAKGQFEFTTFKNCEGGAKTEELKDIKEGENIDESKNDANKEPEKYNDEKSTTDKEVKDEKKEAARRRRMRRYRF